MVEGLSFQSENDKFKSSLLLPSEVIYPTWLGFPRFT